MATTTVHGFELLERIGEGAFGVIHRGRQISVDREVAVKAIRSEYADDPEFAERFELEARLVARLEHPHIAPLYDYWREDGRAYLVMRYFDGGSLKDALARGPWRLDRAARLIEEVGSALSLAHAAGVVHRDVKPANVLLDASGAAYLSDFGIAKLADPGLAITQNQPPLTIAYASPEQLAGREVDHRADIYQLALVAFELVTGHHPYMAGSLEAMIAHHLESPLPGVASHGLPAGLDAVLANATQKDPKDRYPDAASFVADFARAVSGHRVERGPQTRPLPAYATSFVGRAEELAEVARLLAEPECRLLTLVGPGGIGKTRLMGEAAARHQDRGSSVCFVPLGPVDSAANVVSAISDALGFRVGSFSSEVEPRTQLLDYLSGRTMLLALDNFEHVLDAADLVADVLDRCPRVQLLVTSRERLELQAEWVLELAGLPMPPGEEDIEEHPAVLLFRDRARQVDPRFTLGPATAGAVGRICRMVDGLPLGIELAAGWMPTLSVEEIAAEIEQGLDFLESTRRDVPAQHRSLRATFDRSWMFLSADEQACLSRLAVFPGGFTREPARVVAGTDLNMLHGLAAKSLVRRRGGGRFDLHPFVREFAHGLAADPTLVREGHARYYADGLLARRAELSGGPGQLAAVDAVRADLDNVRPAVVWAAGRWSSDDVTPVLHALSEYYFLTNWFEARRVFEHLVRARGDGIPAPARDSAYLFSVLSQAIYASVLAHLDEAEELLTAHREQLSDAGEEAAAKTGVISGIVALQRGDMAAAAGMLEEALPVARASADWILPGLALVWHGWTLLELGDPAAAGEVLEESARRADRAGNICWKAYTDSKLGLVADALGDYEAAIRYHRAGIDAFVELGDLAGQAYSLSRLSWTHWLMGNHSEARRSGLESIDLFRDIGHPWGVMASQGRVGFAELGLGHPAEAAQYFEETLDGSLRAQIPVMTLYAAIGLANVAAVTGRERVAVETLACAAAQPDTPRDYSVYIDPALERLAETMPAEEFAAATARGRNLDPWAALEALRTV